MKAGRWAACIPWFILAACVLQLAAGTPSQWIGDNHNLQQTVYPICADAPPLPSPPHVGKPCFYDRQCRVRCKRLRYPHCDNAAPLPCPPPKGKCCFYNPTCKPQCEDVSSKQCPKLPPCNVVGCSECSTTSADVCVACNAGIGYALNIATNKCDCLPGYAGSSSCQKCSSGLISYGGRLPTPECHSCPTDRVANNDQSECIVPDAWDHWGYDLTNRRWGYTESIINTTTAAGLTRRWTFTTGSDVSATPTIFAGRLYVPDWNGNLFCLEAATGSVIWQKVILDYVLSFDRNPYPGGYNSTNVFSRTSPAISADGQHMIVGVQMKGGGLPYLLDIDPATGALKWGKRMDPHPAAMITQSATIHKHFVYVGVSSLEELSAKSPNYPCCTFIGSMLKVELASGKVVWRTYMAPPNGNSTGGFSGVSIWGSSPSVDVARNQVYIGTGNNYEIPDALKQCIKDLGPLTTDNIPQQLACEQRYGQGNYHNSLLALDMTTGAIRWVKQLGGPDAWNGACLPGSNPANCPDINSPDYDFAQAPMLVTACKGCKCKQLVVAGQKSGWLWALSPDTGAVHWSVPVGPGGVAGGLQWGSAADSSRIYVSNNNAYNLVVNLTTMNAVPNQMGSNTVPTSTRGGLAAAVDAFEGTIVWTFANPAMGLNSSTGANARSQAPMTVANGVVFYASMDRDGSLFTMRADTGKLLNVFQTGMTTGCGPSVVNGRVYIGSGYSTLGLGMAYNKLHMLSTAADVPGRRRK